MEQLDSIIVGGSFAGLAVASRLRGRILLIDRKDFGTGQTSACATLLSVPEAVGASSAIL
jgi:glycerol-3-phosphate dehydrogenase